MSAQRIAGNVAVIAGAGLLVLAVVSSVGGLVSGVQGWSSSSTNGTPAVAPGPWMMGGGPGMMGGGWGPGMMGPGHMRGYGGTSSGTTSEIPGAPTVTVTADEFSFSPSQITLAASGANVTLVNKGDLPHDLTIPALGVRIVANAGQTTTVGLRSLTPGTYPAYCSIPGHAEAGMRMTVTVK
ncbi:MAG: cupredoxin domain-containing protein [Chloroflexota bacterium]|nr:cupredoxin domain-containing protein [Chloroflexota bacterium]